MRWSRTAAGMLGVLLFACNEEKASVERARLELVAEDGLAALPRTGHEAGGETRPAVRIEAGETLWLMAPAAGRVRLTAVAGRAEPRPVLRLARADAAGGETLAELAVGEDWQALADPIPVAAGEKLVAAVRGGGPVWLAGASVESPGPARAAPLMVVVLLDTVRADHTSLDGYPLATTPSLEALAGDGAAFTRAYATSSWTRPSTASLLTSLEPFRHRAIGRFDVLPPEVVTWPEVARQQGYQTVGITTNPNVLATWGFDQGFERFIDLDSAGWDDRGSDAGAVFERALAILDGESLPLFLYLHVLDPHNPYQPPVDAARAIYPDFRADEPGERAAPAVMKWAVRRYDGEIRYSDSALGQFIGALRQRGLYEASAIVVVGDHGEEFGDHGGVSHGKTLYEEQLRVPLVIKLPGGEAAGARVDDLVSISDALPTLAEAARWPALANSQGHSLLPAMRGGPGPRKQISAELRLDGVEAYALVGPREKLIRSVAPEAKAALFDLSDDPGEQRPVDDPARVAAMAATLSGRIAADRAGWHLRLCGGRSERALHFSVGPVRGEFEALGLDAGDRATAVGDRLAFRGTLGPASRTREFGGKEFVVVEEDELIFQAEAPVLRLEAPPDDLRLFVGKTPRAVEERLALAAESARREASDPPVCTAESPASLFVWYVEAPDAVRSDVDPELRARLEALGYLQDD